jgi:hypothetical protein
MRLAGTEKKPFALLNLLTEAIENDLYPLSPRIQTLRGNPRQVWADRSRTTAPGQTANTRGTRPEPPPAAPR